MMPINRSDNKPICPYSYYSFQFFLLFPLVKLSQYVGLPAILSYVVALGLPPFFLDFFIRLLERSMILVRHDPQPDHPHSSTTTTSVVVHSTILGVLFTVGLSFIDNQLQQHFVPLGFYLILLSFFHWSEYFVTSLTNPSTLSPSSFLIYPSLAYVVAITCSLMEFLLEAYMFPGFKKFNVISMIGLIIAIGGEVVRKLAIFTAGRSFTHTISSTKRPDHKLVTHGIYSLFRHPSYSGWFYWAVGSQILLLNPICVIMFSVISCSFFKDRIEYEEETLIEFFNQDYEAYRKRVGVWLPIRLSQPN